MLRRFFSPDFLLPLGLALIVAGAKFALIHFYASDQPFSDQWAAEGAGVIRSSSLELWQFRHFIAPHGEHTPALMRIVTAGTFALNSGQWDAKVEMCVSVLGLVLAGLQLWLIIGATLAERWRLLAVAGVALLLAMPTNSENYLWGFQTPFVYLLAFGLTHVRGTLQSDQLNASWWLAQMAGALSVLTLASGFLSAVALAGYSGLRLWRNPRSAWGWATLGVSLLLSGCGIWLLSQAFFSVERTTSISLGLLPALGHLLAWPIANPWVALIVQAPAVLLAVWARRRLAERRVELLLVLALWCLLLTAAIAWGRGGGAGQIAGRYQDHLTLGLAANLIILCFLAANAAMGRVGRVLAAVWVVLLAGGVYRANHREAIEGRLEANRDFFSRQERVVAGFLATGDPVVLKSDAVVLPYLPHLDQTRALLEDPVMRTMLPPSLAPALAVQRDPGASVAPAGFRPAATAQPNNARVLALQGGAAGTRFVSKPLADDFRPLWRIRVSGRVGPGASQVRLRAIDGRTILPYDHEYDAHGRWKTIHVSRGAGPVQLEITVPPHEELRLTEPIELGWLSWAVPKLAAAWLSLLLLGVAALLTGGVLAARHRTVTRGR